MGTPTRDDDGIVRWRREGRVGHLVLDRPRSRNALTGSMVEALAEIVEGLRADDTVDVVALSAVGPDFCAGADVGDIAAVLRLDAEGRARSFVQGLSTTVHPLMAGLLGLPQIVVAAARGHAVGLGAALVLAADLVVLSESALVTVPQVRLGHTSDHGESWLLPRRVGLGRAMQISLLGERVSAVDAERFGMANWVTADRELEARAAAVVEALRKAPSASVRHTKDLLRRSADNDLGTQLAAEARSAAGCAATADFVEAVTALQERRTPVFGRG